ncbi:MAG: zf-TFIIB domain-containing protein [Deltaproteobacteria bacterium]|nr:zf-TFIIB domain-containing protein [Deltaproteobacteria bacterium]
MRCPLCVETTLEMSMRQEIEIDYCPKCRGVWLDRGELEKLIERAASPQYSPQYGQEKRSSYHDDDDDDRGRGRKRSFLSELFD